jgi:hypothetical protein
MNEHYVEIFNVQPERPVPTFVATHGDWQEACRIAAREPFVEIIVYDDDNQNGVVVYSDDPDVHSGGWWTEHMRAERRRIGR